MGYSSIDIVEMKVDAETLATDWIKFHELSNEIEQANSPLFYAVETLILLVDHDPKLCWSIVIQIYQLINDDRLKAVLSAGPFESLIVDCVGFLKWDFQVAEKRIVADLSNFVGSDARSKELYEIRKRFLS